MDEFFYGTLPQDTQDFTQVLKGVRRSIGDVARGVSYYPYDLVGAPVDIINMALTPMGLGSQQPVLGSDYLRNIGKSLGLAQDPTGSIPETVSRIGAGFINPAAGARAVGQIPQAITRGANVSADKLVQMITQNPRATAMGVIDETSMPFMQAMAPKTPAVPGLMEPAKSDIGFYSQLEAATIPLQNKGTGDQYLAQIQKSAGVKPEEIQWTGLDEFLKGKKSVTKAEIQDYLQANRVDVQEVRLGEFPKTLTAQEEALYDDLYLRYRNDPNSINNQEYDLLMDLENRANEEISSTLKPKFSSYTLPGGENYREILLTLPQKVEKGFMTPNGAFFSEADLADPIVRSTAEKIGLSPAFRNVGDAYRSSHFDQPNILAHMRVNDRVVDGKKTLFIEEIQSDWHQAGRKKGYATSEKAELPEGTKVFEPGAADSPGQTNQAFTVQIPRAVNGRTLFYGTTREEALANAQSFIAQPSLGAVPDAPFKTSWHELTLKRAIQEASEKGYDQIAFTTGKTQAERYDLSKQVDELLYKKNPDGTYRLSAQVRGRGQSFGDSIPESKLEEYVGKEVAKSITQGSGKDVNLGGPGSFTQPRDDWKSMSGLDLKVGGEGMKGFYDNILPKSLEKLGKKFDAKVGKTEMDGVEVWQMDITPKMRESVTTKGQPLFAVPAIGAGLLGAGMYQDEQMY